jgi:hypothetical protein
MKFWEAMKALEEGEEVRCVEWPKGDRCSYGNLWSCMKNHAPESYGWKWELYEEPQRTLSFSEIVQGLKEGKRFRRKRTDGSHTIIVMSQNREDIAFAISGSQFLRMEDFEATDWVEVKE